MEAGKLDRKIRIEQPQLSRNAAGEKTRNWIPLALNVAAGVVFPTTRQVMNGQQMQSEVDATFTVRYRIDLAPKEDRRIIFDGRTFRIKGVRELGRRVGLAVDCTTRAE
jgi:SPP1 family predicted phage head-tail adaptor